MKITSIESEKGPVASGGYSQATLIEGASKRLYISGQIPETEHGCIPEGFEPQCRIVWENVLSQLNAAKMTTANLVKVTTFLSSREHSDANSLIRQEYLGENKPALTVIISGIYDEKWLLEIEAVAYA